MNILFNYARKKNKSKNLKNKKNIKSTTMIINHKNKNIEQKFRDYQKHRKKIDFKIIDESFTFDCKNEDDIAIIIPYRNREEHLEKLKEHFKNTNFDIYIIDQCDTQRFNRGILLNIGYYLAKNNKQAKNYKYYIFHDVDSLPDEKLLKQYCYSGENIIHYASPFLDYKYSHPNFLGGVLGMTSEIFEKMNGFPNRIYGWGGEDDMLYNRIAVNNYKVYRPKEGKYILLDHPQASGEEVYKEKWEGILRDLKEWKSDGLKEGDKLNIDTNFIVLSEKITKNPNIYFYKVKIPIQHVIKQQYMSLMRPLITWKEVKENILDTFIEPEKFNEKNKLNKNQKIFEKIIDEKMELYKNKNNKNNEYTKKQLEKSLKFIFDTYRDILYLRIRQNHIEFAFHLYNSEFTSDWYKYVKFPNDMNVYDFMKKKQKNLPSKTEKILPPNKWTANNCVVSFEDWSSYGNPTEYVKGIYEMFIKMIEKYKNVPDCDILINRKDFQYLHIDKERYAYTHVYPENVKIPNHPKNYWFLCSQSSSKNNLDIPIPSADEFKNALNENDKNKNKLFNTKNFESKENKLFFRGGTTGCGLNENTNPRLRLYMISDILNKEGDSFFDIGLAMFTKKIKVNDFEVGYLDIQKYKYLQKDFVDMSVWKKYKYFLNIEGNVAAYRLPTLFSYGGVVVQAESDYNMWFEPLLKDGEDYILLKKEVYMNSGDSIEESAKKVKDFFNKTISKNQKNMVKIAENGFKFYKKYLNKESIYDYCYTLCYLINKNIC
jgi:hypothetical protein